MTIASACRSGACAVAIGAAVLMGPAIGSGEPAKWKLAEPAYTWSFPRDHWPHSGYRTEWWYFTGQLVSKTDPSRRFGYQFTLFRVGLAPEKPVLQSAWAASDLVMGHAAITDLTTKSHTFAEVLWRAGTPLGGFAASGERPIAWARAAPGTAGRWSVDWDGEEFAFAMRDDARGIALDLKTRPAKPLVLQGPNGYSRKGTAVSAASQYYSFTRLDTAGSIRSGNVTVNVTGTSWMDKEFGSSQLSPSQAGWDWFSLQLDDGREMMLYIMRRADGTPDYRNATFVARDGTASYPAPSEWSVSSTAWWTSRETKARYPARWAISVGSEGLRLDVVPLLADQENVSRLSGGIAYWEGAVEIRDHAGRAIGHGFVELTGYGEKTRPPL